MRQVNEFDQHMLEIYSELDLDRLTDLAVQYATRRLGAGGCSIFLRDDISGRYVLRGTTGLSDLERMPAMRVEYELGEGLTGWIARHGHPLRIANPADEAALQHIAGDLFWSRKYSELSAKPGLAYLGVPVLARDAQTVLGVLRVSRKAEGQAFTTQDEDLLSHVAALMGVAIENSQRYERERRRARYFRLLLEISGEVTLRRPVAETLRALAVRVQQGFRTEACLIYLQAEEDREQVVLQALSGIPETLLGLRFNCREGVTGQTFGTGRPVQIRAKSAFERWDDPRMQQIAALLPSREYRSYIGVPLRLGDQTFGMLELINKVPSAPGHRDWFTDDDEEYLTLLATSVSGALEGARYLKTLGDVSVTALKLQRVAAFGALAQRIRHEAANPLTVARLGMANLRRDLNGILPAAADAQTAHAGQGFSPERRAAIARRLEVVETSLDRVSDKLLEMLHFSQQIGFVRATVQWNELVRGVLIWLSADLQQRNLDVHSSYGELPNVFVEANEMFGVLATGLRLGMQALGAGHHTLELRTVADAAGKAVRTEFCVPDASTDGISVSERLGQLLEPAQGSPEELLPMRLEWALAKETVEREYGGTIEWRQLGGAMCFVLELPARSP
jgi:GAF domain-containing protein